MDRGTEGEVIDVPRGLERMRDDRTGHRGDD
jgi:hypothetical protein